TNRNSSPRLARTRAGILAAAAILVAAFAFYAGPRVVLAQEEHAPEVNPASNEAPKQESNATVSITPDEPIGGAATLNLNTESKRRKKAKVRIGTSALAGQPAEVAVVAPEAPMAAPARIVAPVPMVAPVTPFLAQADAPQPPNESGMPRPARVRRDESL